MDEAKIFADLPDELAFGNHSAFVFIERVAARDMLDGLDEASRLFDEYTMQQFNIVKELHILLLVATIVLMTAFIFLKYRPYVKRVKAESKLIAGLLSQLPAEVDVLPQVKQVVLGIKKEDTSASLAAAQTAGMPGMLMPPGAMYPGAMMMSQQGAPGMGYHPAMYGNMDGTMQFARQSV